MRLCSALIFCRQKRPCRTGKTTRGSHLRKTTRGSCGNGVRCELRASLSLYAPTLSRRD
jgi:hypothetical protein